MFGIKKKLTKKAGVSLGATILLMVAGWLDWALTEKQGESIVEKLWDAFVAGQAVVEEVQQTLPADAPVVPEPPVTPESPQ